MAGPVFISFSSENQAEADRVLAGLRASGLECWRCTEDIAGGAVWPEAIVKAIQSARVGLFLVSDAFCASRHTARELTLADNYGLRLLPIRLSETRYSKAAEYYLCNCHWVDTAAKRIDDWMPVVVEAVQEYVRQSGDIKAPAPGPPPSPGCVTPEAVGLRRATLAVPITLGRPPLGFGPTDSPSSLLMPHHEFIPLLGREAELRAIAERLDQEGDFRWWVMYGDAGMGKTRLAHEVVQRAAAMHWRAGFLTGKELHSFVEHDDFMSWRPCVPTLIVIDYASRLLEDIKKLVAQLARLQFDARSHGSRAKVRLLLLERHGNVSDGWLRQLLEDHEGASREVIGRSHLEDHELSAPSLSESGDGQQREACRQIITATFEAWRRRSGEMPPPLPDFTDQEWDVIRLNTGLRPLYIQMAAISACDARSAEQLPSWGRGDCLADAVKRERDYILRACPGSEEQKAVEVVAGMLCVTGVGTTHKREWHALHDELVSRSRVAPTKEEALRNTIFHMSLATSRGGTGLIQPDIIGGGFAATVLPLSESQYPPHRLLQRAVAIGGGDAWGNLIRMVQDLHGLEVRGTDGRRRPLFPGIEGWLIPLLEGRTSSELREILAQIPQRSASLHPFGIRTAELLLASLQHSSALERADCLLALGIHRARLSGVADKTGSHQAEVELREACALLDALRQSEDSEDLRVRCSMAHRMLGLSLSNQGNPSEALAESLIASCCALGDLPSPALGKTPIRDVIDRPTPEVPRLAIELASALNNLSIDLRTLSRDVLALECAQRAVIIGEGACGEGRTPAQRRFWSDWARYLNNLSQAQERRGAHDAALRSARRSVAIRVTLAEDRPDEFGEPLALSLDHLLKVEMRRGDWSAAQLTAARAVRAYKDLYLRDPNRHLLHLLLRQRDLARVRRNAGVELQGADLDAEVDAMAEEQLKSGRLAVRLAVLVMRNPVTPSVANLSMRELGVLYHHEADRLGKSHRIADAARSARLAVQHLQQVADGITRDRDLYHWATAQCDLASALLLLGDFAKDLIALRAAVERAQEITQHISPREDRYRFVWGATMHNLGHAQYLLGVRTPDRTLIRQGAATLSEARAHFTVHGFQEAARATELILEAANAAAAEPAG